MVITSNDIDIACITESWLTASMPSDLINIEGYSYYRRDRSSGQSAGGGVLCYIKNTLSVAHLVSLQSDTLESLWFLYRYPPMPRGVSDIIVGLIYHPPGGNNK